MTENKFSLIASKTYAITINPCDEVQFFSPTCLNSFTPAMRWQRVTDRLTEFMNNQDSFTFEIYFECSTPDHYNRHVKSRIHCHGFINIHDLPQFLLIDINRLGDWCDIKIKELTNEDGYRQYCLKQADDLISLYPLYHSSENEHRKKNILKQREQKRLENRFKGFSKNI